MDADLIDWEATIRETQLAARAASRGTERIAGAVAEIREQQASANANGQKALALAKELIARTDGIEATLAKQHVQTQKELSHLIAKPKETRWQRSNATLALILGGSVLFGAFIGNLF